MVLKLASTVRGSTDVVGDCVLDCTPGRGGSRPCEHYIVVLTAGSTAATACAAGTAVARTTCCGAGTREGLDLSYANATCLRWISLNAVRIVGRVRIVRRVVDPFVEASTNGMPVQTTAPWYRADRRCADSGAALDPHAVIHAGQNRFTALRKFRLDLHTRVHNERKRLLEPVRSAHLNR
jgi:hypothetical protein